MIPSLRLSWLSPASRKPSPYPSSLLHTLHFASLVSSLILVAILGFFVQHLRDEELEVPWTFLLLLATSVLTLVHLIGTNYLHVTRTLSPAAQFYANAFLTVCWVVSLILLFWNISWTLGHRCIVTRWHNQAGVMICRMYKALTAFAVCGTASIIGTLVLDISVRRKTKERGVYENMDRDKTASVPRLGDVGEQSHELARFGESWERRSHEGSRAYKVQKPIEARQFGYEEPSEQTSYGGGSKYM